MKYKILNFFKQLKKESLIVYWLLVRGFSNWSKNLARFYEGAPIADNIRRNDNIPQKFYLDLLNVLVDV